MTNALGFKFGKALMGKTAGKVLPFFSVAEILDQSLEFLKVREEEETKRRLIVGLSKVELDRLRSIQRLNTILLEKAIPQWQYSLQTVREMTGEAVDAENLIALEFCLNALVQLHKNPPSNQFILP